MEVTPSADCQLMPKAGDHMVQTQYMFPVLVCTCSVLPDFYDFQSFTNLHNLDTVHRQRFNGPSK